MNEEEYKRLSELLILKHRNGQADRFIKEKFMGEFSRFTPLDDADKNEPVRVIEQSPMPF